MPSTTAVFGSPEDENPIDNHNRATIGSETDMDIKDSLYPIYRELTDIKSEIKDIKRDMGINFRWIISVMLASTMGMCGFLVHMFK